MKSKKPSEPKPTLFTLTDLARAWDSSVAGEFMSGGTFGTHMESFIFEDLRNKLEKNAKLKKAKWTG